MTEIAGEVSFMTGEKRTSMERLAPLRRLISNSVCCASPGDPSSS